MLNSFAKVVVSSLTQRTATWSIVMTIIALVSPRLLAVTLSDVNFTELPGGKIEIRSTFTDVPQYPKSYVVEEPARIVLDFEGVENGLKEKKFNLSYGNAKSALVLSSNGRTRFIINLISASTHISAIEGNTLITTIESSTPPQTFTRQQSNEASSQTFTDKRAVEIVNVDFRRTTEGAGTLLIDLSNPKVIIDIEESASGIAVNILDAKLPNSLRRRLDVVDFATPISIIESKMLGNNTQFQLEVTDEYDFFAYQADKQYVITVKPLTEDELLAREERFQYVGEKLSLNFQDIKVRAVLEIIAQVTDLNLVASDTVDGNITLRLDNVPWDQALDLVLRSRGLDKRQTGNVLLVAPAAEIAERERQEIETRNQLQELAPLRTEFVRIRYARAEDIYALFQGQSGSGGDGGASTTRGILSDRGSAIVDERTNSIILTETAEKIADFKRIVAELDIPVRQVMIEARIVIANDDFRRELGIRIAGDGATFRGDQIEVTGSLEGLINNDGQGPEGVFIDSDGDGIRDDERDIIASNLVDLAAPQAAGSLAFNIISDHVLLGLELTALESTGYAEVVSQPKVITGDSQAAKILSGSQIPYTSSDGDEVSTIFKDAALSLEVTPQITPDNRVIMDLKINQDSIGELTNDGPTIDVTELTTNVLVGDGQTIVLGGIFQQNTINGTTKVPFFGDLPVIGRLFKSTSKRDEKQELLIFITPRILSDALID